MTIYLIGSLRNPKIVEIGNVLREAQYDVFEDWHAGGPTADDEWMRYEKERGHTYQQALAGYHAAHVFNYDKHHLDRADAGVLIAPGGRSAHLELGYIIGQGKPGFILFTSEPERWDVMALFATAICFSLEELVQELAVFMKHGELTKHEQRPGRRTVDHAPWNA